MAAKRLFVFTKKAPYAFPKFLLHTVRFLQKKGIKTRVRPSISEKEADRNARQYSVQIVEHFQVLKGYHLSYDCRPFQFTSVFSAC